VDLPARLIDLSAAVTWDGGDGVIGALGRHLADLLEFDQAELILPKVFGFDRWTLSESPDALLPDDVLLHLLDQPDPVRIDDVSALSGFDRGRAELLERGIQTILTLPLGSAGGPRGLVVMGRSSTWGFAGAPLTTLTPLVGMAGLSIETAAALTKVRRDAELAQAELERIRAGKGPLKP
jgi:GAF domain-containing protein